MVPTNGPPQEFPAKPTASAAAGCGVGEDGGDETGFTLSDEVAGAASSVVEARVPGAGSTTDGLPHADANAVVGRRVGRYILVTRLGAGRQSVVWRALRVEPRVQVVALKIFKPRLTLDRMERLARAQNAALGAGPPEDSAILPVFESGVVKGHVYTAMPLIDGGTLNRALKRRRAALVGAPEPARLGRLTNLPPTAYLGTVAGLVGRVARGLGRLHAAGLAHCDVKPENILLDWADRAYLSDFGLAYFLDEPPVERRPARALGTPLYMAPEKLLLRDDRDELRCDVYSLGVTLYEAATLSRPCHVPRELPRSTWAAFLASSIPPSPRAVQPLIPRDLEAIILRAMARNPAHRYADAAHLADALDDYGASGPIPA